MKIRVLCVLLLSFIARDASAEPDAAALFTRKCSSCHTFGKGDLVGPDLKGVTDRHDRKWLTAWIASSETMIRSGDAAATSLFKKYKRERMPDQAFAPGELVTLIDYLAAGGPEADARKKNRRADTATPEEIATGGMLFVGQRAMTGGGVSCISCHRAGQTAARGGSLGPDLMHSWSRFQDKGLASLLARGCFPRLPYTSGRSALTEEESFALRAFLRHVDISQRVAGAARTAVRQ